MRNCLYLIAMVVIVACSKDDSFPYPPSSASIAAEFNNRYNLDINEAPVVFNEFNGHYVSVIYANGSRYKMYVYPNSHIVTGTIQPIFPKGELEVLCIVRLCPKLVALGDTFIQNWEEAQNAINLQHANYAQSIGLEESIVQFNNHNYYLTQEDMPEHSEQSMEDFREFATQNDLDIDAFDIYLFMDLDQDNPSGGIGSWRGRFAKVGWFYDDPEINEERYTGLAFAAYHHEIGHVWGCDHEWSDPYDDHQGFIADPSLFGWTDLNGNGIPEILEEDGYH